MFFTEATPYDEGGHQSNSRESILRPGHSEGPQPTPSSTPLFISRLHT
jgi:hypothetical protein